MNIPVPEFSRIVSVTRLSPKGIEEALEAKPAERKALAKRFDLVDLLMLEASLILTPEAQKTVTVTGNIRAEVTQRCIVTLEPLTSRLNLDVNVIFIPEGSTPDIVKGPQEAELDDEFECFTGGKIDIGEMVAQQLGVNIDPYPRKANARLDVSKFTKKTAKTQPLAKLAGLVKGKKIKDKH